jgi:ABC-type transport system involved in cytochrome bd biosynthesis fused ATPase/permease subunit
MSLLQKYLFYKYHDKTIIIISHRMENLDLFDHFIKFSSGHIVEDVRKAKGDNL